MRIATFSYLQPGVPPDLCFEGRTSKIWKRHWSPLRWRVARQTPDDRPKRKDKDDLLVDL